MIGYGCNSIPFDSPADCARQRDIAGLYNSSWLPQMVGYMVETLHFGDMTPRKNVLGGESRSGLDESRSGLMDSRSGLVWLDGVSKWFGEVSKWIGEVSKWIGGVSKRFGEVSKWLGGVSKWLGGVCSKSSLG